MKSSAKKVELAPYDDLFSTEESRQDAKLEKVREIPLSELHPFKNHPFKVKDDEAMMETADSVRQYRQHFGAVYGRGQFLRNAAREYGGQPPVRRGTGFHQRPDRQAASL